MVHWDQAGLYIHVCCHKNYSRHTYVDPIYQYAPCAETTMPFWTLNVHTPIIIRIIARCSVML